MQDRTLNRRTTFEVKNGAYNVETVQRDIKDIISKYAGISRVHACSKRHCSDYRDNRHDLVVPTNCISHLAITNRLTCNPAIKGGIDLPDIDFSSYYMPDGRKVTKPLRTVLVKLVGKEKTNAIFADFCNDVTALYSPKFEALASFEDGSMLGRTDWGDRHSCFKEGGCNEKNGDFVTLNKRVQILVIDDQQDNKARCLCYFKGGRTIFLTNFYYNGLNNNKFIFVEAFRHLMNLDKISFKVSGEGNDLPVYLNGDGIRIQANPIDYNRDTSFICPICEGEFKKAKLRTNITGNTYHIACSTDCLTTSEESCYDGYCANCSEGLHEDDESVWMDDGDRLCQCCYDDLGVYCEGCEEHHYNDSVRMEYNESGYGYCSDHFKECDDCDTIMFDDDYICLYNGDILCHDCASFCEECGSDYRASDGVELANGDYVCEDCAVKCEECKECYVSRDLDNNDRCDDCAADFEDCEECGKECHVNDLDGGHCEDCTKEDN